MSKYGYSPESGAYDRKTRFLNAIANELAERNRLKRLELQDKLKGANESVDWDLSDKA